MTKMKVLYLVSGNHLYGDNRSFLDTVLELVDKASIYVIIGVRRDQLVSSTSSPLIDMLNKYNIPFSLVSSILNVPRLKIGEHISFRYFKGWIGLLKNSISSISKYRFIIKSFKPDIIHSNNSMFYGGKLLSALYKIRHVWHLREYIDKDHNYKHWPSRLFLTGQIHQQYAIANSQGVYDYFKLTMGMGRLIYNPIGFDVTFQQEKDNYILFVGRLLSTKGVLELINIFEKLYKDFPDLRLLIAGGIDENDLYVKKLFALRDELPCAASIIFLGYRSDVSDLMKNAKCLVVPSYFEAFGRITAEALFKGCLVVGRNTGGTKEILSLCNSGYLYESDKECLEQIKTVILMKPDDYKKKIESAQKVGVNYFSQKVVASKVFDFYIDILSKDYKSIN